MKVFITGGTGNIGQYVTLAVLKNGHEAVVLSRTPKKHSLMGKKAKLVKGKITDYDLIKNYVKGCDAVIHIALGWGNEPASMLINDTAAAVKLLEIAEKAGVKKFIYTSSTAAMGQMRHNMDETYVNLPIDLYGSTKAASEAFVLGFRKYYGKDKEVKMKRNIIRPGYTYSNPAFPGGSTEPDARFRNIASAIVKNKPIELTKHDGTQFISAEEIALVYLRLLESDFNEEVFLALGNTWYSWEDIADTMLMYSPKSKSKVVLKDLGWGSDPMLFNVKKMENELGLSFDTRPELHEHIKWCLEQASHLGKKSKKSKK